MLYDRRLKGYLTLLPAPAGGSAIALTGTSGRASSAAWDGLVRTNPLRNQGAFGCDTSRRLGSIFG